MLPNCLVVMDHMPASFQTRLNGHVTAVVPAVVTLEDLGNYALARENPYGQELCGEYRSAREEYSCYMWCFTLCTSLWTSWMLNLIDIRVDVIICVFDYYQLYTHFDVCIFAFIWFICVLVCDIPIPRCHHLGLLISYRFAANLSRDRIPQMLHFCVRQAIQCCQSTPKCSHQNGRGVQQIHVILITSSCTCTLM